jgi:hypothetical protein
MEPVLDGLRLGNSQEEQWRDRPVVRVPDRRLHPDVAVVVDPVLPSEYRRPESGQRQWLHRVDAEGGDL